MDQLQLSNIQNQLNINGYGNLERDGLWGPATREALSRLCLDFTIETGDDLASQLQGVLELATVVGQQVPKWRELIKTQGFKNWLSQQTDQQTLIANTLQSGPPDEAIAILKRYPGSQAAIVQKAVEKKAAEQKARSTNAPGPDVFYRWQTDEADTADAGDEQADQAAEAPALADTVLEKLQVIEGVSYPNQSLFVTARKQLISDTACDLYCQNQILDQARNGPIEDLKRILLSGGQCGCSEVYSDFSTVYGFYPFWMASGEEQQVDFSLFDRIGFYALTLNNSGFIKKSVQWSNSGDAAAFIAKAHRYRVKVDVVIYASNWQSWSDDVITTAALTIAARAIEKFHYSHTSGIRAIFPFLEDTTSVKADGVTLYFDEYATADQGRRIVLLVSRVAEALKQAGADTSLNIMLGMDIAAIEQKKLFEGLSCIVLDDATNKNKRKACAQAGVSDSEITVDHVLAFLPERTTDTKKILRRTIEDEFHGLDRKTVLRKIIPIIPPSGHEIDNDDSSPPFSQFRDDLIYFQDNFAGVGLWPLPLDSHEDIEAIKSNIIELYKETNGTNRLRGMIDSHAPWLCTFACPNRWLFRLAFDILAGALLIYALCAIWICQLRAFFRQRLILFVAIGAATVLIMLISLICDPYWHDRADRVVLMVFLILLAAMIWKYVSRATQPPLP